MCTPSPYRAGRSSRRSPPCSTALSPGGTTAIAHTVSISASSALRTGSAARRFQRSDDQPVARTRAQQPSSVHRQDEGGLIRYTEACYERHLRSVDLPSPPLTAQLTHRFDHVVSGQHVRVREESPMSVHG